MILDRTWNKREQKLTISYIDKIGKRKFWQKYLPYINTYEYNDKNGEFNTWNHRKCSRVKRSTADYRPNNFDILEMLYELPKEEKDNFYAMYFPELYTFDIETEISNEFPDPYKAEMKVTSISVVAPDLSVMIMGLNDMTDEGKEDLKLQYTKWIEEHEYAKKIYDKICTQKDSKYDIRVLYKKFNSEQEMLEHFFKFIVPKCPVMAGWNSFNFDWNYLWNRLVRLFGEKGARNLMYAASPTRELGKVSWKEMDGTSHSVPAPAHSIILDYQELCKSYDYVLTYESYSLNWVSEHAVNAKKIEYKGDLQSLYINNPHKYYFYNAIDSLLIQMIHHRLKCIESPCSVSSVTLVSLQEAFSQIRLTEANVFKEFYDDNVKVVYDRDEILREKKAYAGAFCGCVPGRFEWCVCDDFASLYPSQVITCNFSFENFHQNMVGPDSLGRYTPVPWLPADLEKFRQDPNYFVSVNNNVYKNDKDYCFKKMQKRTKKNRDVYKYTGQRIESELLTAIDKLIEEKSV